MLSLSPAALKRSFEVEDVDATSPTTRRNANSHQRSGISSGSQSYYDLGSRANHANSAGTRPQDSQQRPKARTPEPVSRRSELCIDISSNHKSVENSPSQGVSRFALKRPEVLGHSKTPELAQKHTVTFSKPLETTPAAASGPRAVAPHASAKLPETTFRRTEPPSPGEVAGSRRPEISVTKAPDAKAQENHHHHPHHPPQHHHHPHPPQTLGTRCASPNHTGRKSPQDGHSKCP